MRSSTIAVALAAVLAFSASANAQQAAPQLEAGRWTGVVTPPDGNAVDVTYDVAYDADKLLITVNAGEHGSFKAIEPKFEAGKITFGLQVGSDLHCVLNAKEEGFGGLCTEAGGDISSAGTMTMLPPKKESNEVK